MKLIYYYFTQFVVGLLVCAIVLLCLIGFNGYDMLNTARLRIYLTMRGFSYNYVKIYDDGTILLNSDYCRVSNISCLEGLPIRELNLSVTDVKHLWPLQSVGTLEHLGIAMSQVEDISILSNLHNLKFLSIRVTKVSDLTPLSNLPLEALYAGHSAVTNIAPVATPHLKILSITGCDVKDLSPLTNAVNLYDLMIDLDRFPKNGEQIQILRNMKSIRDINHMASESIWEEYETQTGEPSGGTIRGESRSAPKIENKDFKDEIRVKPKKGLNQGQT